MLTWTLTHILHALEIMRLALSHTFLISLGVALSHTLSDLTDWLILMHLRSHWNWLFLGVFANFCGINIHGLGGFSKDSLEARFLLF